jgi:hypothetical protein
LKFNFENSEVNDEISSDSLFNMFQNTSENKRENKISEKFKFFKDIEDFYFQDSEEDKISHFSKSKDKTWKPPKIITKKKNLIFFF